MIGGLGFSELLIILLIVIIIFGASKLPQLGKGLGEGIRNFKGSLTQDDADAGGSGSSDTSTTGTTKGTTPEEEVSDR
jgi:sec-independent protein translocase protein TatA